MPLRDMDREQMWLLPPSLDELLPLDHPARFVAEFVDALDRDDWAELGVDVDGDPLGAPAYHPRALLSVWLYGFMTGVRSCRKLEAACRDQIPYLWLTGWQHPDHNTLWRFYKEYGDCPLMSRIGAKRNTRQSEHGAPLKYISPLYTIPLRTCHAKSKAGVVVGHREAVQRR